MEPTSEYQAGTTRPQQRRWLVGGLVLLAAIVAGAVVLDRSGANSHRNRVQHDSHLEPTTPR